MRKHERPRARIRRAGKKQRVGAVGRNGGARHRANDSTHYAVSDEADAYALREQSIVKYVRGSESNCEQDSRGM